ncbi:MAG: F0F1 ATP synthase subunit A [Clostridiales bacterium]|jgi:F-type H+-transporting ATPase subunit a|nr:F0F1 ATP synthase subunit A [Clostridiales bacterium]
MFQSIFAAEGKDISEILREALSPEKTEIFGMKLGPGVISAFIVVAIVAVLCLLIRFVFLREYKAVPKGMQLVLEKVVSFFEKMAKDSTHSYSKYIAPVILGVGAYIFLGTVIEVVGLKPIFSDLNAGLAIGFIAFMTIQILGIKKKGVGGRLKAQFQSEKGAGGIMVGAVKTLSDFILPFSMALRLYGSILSGMLIADLLYIVVDSLLSLTIGVSIWAVPIGLVVAGVIGTVLTVFHALIQTYVFGTLVSLFTGEVIE